MSSDHPVVQVQDDGFQSILEQTMAGNLELDDLDVGEKADDAIDFEDISDTELAADEDAMAVDSEQGRLVKAAGGIINHDSHGPRPRDTVERPEQDDLFEEEGLQPSEVDQAGHDVFGDRVARLFRGFDQPDHISLADGKFQQVSKEEQLQYELFARSRASVATDSNLPEPPENTEQLLRALWPKYQKDAIPRFMELLPPNKARFLAKTITRPPRNLCPTKLSLNLSLDHEKTFKVSSESHKRPWHDMDCPGQVTILSPHAIERRNDQDSDDEAADSDLVNDEIPHLDLQVLCEDWRVAEDLQLEPSSQKLRETPKVRNNHTSDDYQSPTTRDVDYHLQTDVMQWLEEPERSTARISKRIKLDLNDSRMLFDYHPSQRALKSLDNRRHLPLQLTRRYNISNDDEYDLLRENHQNKIRGVLGNLQLDHAMPALRLQWPFYQTRLGKQQARSFHRPSLKVSRYEQISFTKPNQLKKKSMKGKEAHALFQSSSDLSLADNSNALLLEYSEEHPMILSNLGMGNRVINHYRKKFVEDSHRPKLEIGDLNPLLPNDKSPLTLFGFVDSGHVVSAVQNEMYQAPIFKQEPSKTDLLVIKTTTGFQGTHWYIRNVDHLYVVGQQFPIVEIPGSNSRKVSTAAKNRLKMIAYRLARKDKSQRISVSAVTKHFPDTTDTQNRQKMKDFMQFDKVEKEWKPKRGESIPEEAIIRSMVKPEDVCLLESMQTGEQHLLDAGVVKLGEEIGAANDTQDNDHIETKLAPWFASKHFLQSTQGKAMLELHGEGDPTGRGEAISMVKTSMKGGFKSQGSSATERIEDKKDKEKGHTYNVQRQTQAYEESIRRIWDAQTQSLASNVVQSDSDSSDDLDEEAQQMPLSTSIRTEARTSASGRHFDDETASQSSRWSTSSQSGKMLEITRTVRDTFGGQEMVRDVIRNPRIIRQYIRRRNALHSGNEDVAAMNAGSDAAENKRIHQKLQIELARLNRNKDRRIARDKQKGVYTDGTTEPDGSPVSPGTAQLKAGATQRKCANCGQTGHIKTNKKLCPLLNGKMEPSDGFNSNAFTSGAST